MRNRICLGNRIPTVGVLMGASIQRPLIDQDAGVRWSISGLLVCGVEQSGSSRGS
jgi:hypothetical protein